ncbi:MAG: NUDIX hydrolase, partial [Candidatus Hodarchaeota archaeon]
AIITDPKHKYLLIGERAHKSDYRPGYQAIPGGIYEKGDSESSLLKACLRELKEEVTIDVNQHSFYLIAMVREASGLGICLLVEVETTSPDSPLKKIQGKEEWERNILEWIKFSQIREIRHDKISERLYFLRSKLEEE